jgi:4-hydroxy-2-oxoheptanedioate aldolase
VHPDKAKDKLKAGGTVIGAYVRHPDPGLTEILGYLGFDYLLFDSEHAPINERELENLVRTCELTGVTSIARVPSNLPWTIGRCLDAAKYQPLGNRGLAAARAANYAQVQPFSFPAHIEASNAGTMVVVQVETPAAIDALPEIVEVPDIDVIFIGPTDLSNCLGHPGDFKHPDVRSAFDRIVSIVTKSDKALGVLTGNAEDAIEWRGKGARYLMSVLESLIAPAIRGYLKAVREG